MIISTKGRYALRVMTELASRQPGVFVPLKEIAERQDISIKYLERIALALTQASYIESSHGRSGGYRLSRDPEEYTVLEILETMEGDIAPISCLECNADPCSRAAECMTLDMWKGFYKMTREYYGSIRLSDLAKTSQWQDYVI